jgi:hypothetical protein
MLKEVQRDQTLVSSVQKEWNQVQEEEEEEEERISCQLLLSSLFLFLAASIFKVFRVYAKDHEKRSKGNLAREIFIPN